MGTKYMNNGFGRRPENAIYGYDYIDLARPSGSVLQPNHAFLHTDNGIDELWDRMYVNPKPVIVACGYCNSHNAISNPTCVQCGAPMGAGRFR